MPSLFRQVHLWKNELDETVITNDYKQNKNAIEYGKMLKDEYINSEIEKVVILLHVRRMVDCMKSYCMTVK